MWCALDGYIFNQSVFTFAEVSIACSLVLATSEGLNPNQDMCNFSFSPFSPHWLLLPCAPAFDGEPVSCSSSPLRLTACYGTIRTSLSFYLCLFLPCVGGCNTENNDQLRR